MSNRPHWSSRFAFILAAAGSAIGLGNIWKFPYMAGVSGGGAFVLIYLLCVALVGLPILTAELYIGQKSQKNAVEAFEVTHKKGTLWKGVGYLGIIAAFLILSFYSVVGGWVLDFEVRSILGEFQSKSDDEISGLLGSLFSNPIRQLIFHFIFMMATIGIVVGGIKNGIEKWNRILMPALFVILAFLFLRSLFLPGFGEALNFLFSPQWDKLSDKIVLDAVGQAFFSLSIGLGVMITYGSYLDKKENLLKIAFSVALMDTLIAIFAGIVVFSVVFTYQLEPAAGPKLVFQTLPVLFAKMTGGYLVAVAFFLLISFAAFTSSISLLESVVTYLVDRHKIKRKKAALYTGGAAFLLGILSVLSFNIFSNVRLFGRFTFFDFLDKITSSLFLPFGGMCISLYLGWVLGPKATETIIGRKASLRIPALGLLWVMRVVAPTAVAIMLINGIQDW